MGVLTQARAAFTVGDVTDPIGRSLLLAQFDILRKQIPVLYLALLTNSISVALVLPPTVSMWLRVVLPAVLLGICVFRLIQWLRLKSATYTAEQAYAQLLRTRRVAVVLNAGFVVWILALFLAVDPALRAAVSLLLFMGCIGTAYCLASSRQPRA